MYDSSNLIQ